ncbi:hypothetical protein GCM10022254_67260 [Actinomadura meridiana]|uniref:ATP-binding protein n=1 Tax=Actinomadura meridiana TaxID=559626 RepID=A0ABP8CM99_9ACTN
MTSRINQHATASGFARIFQSAGNMTVYEATNPYRLATWPTHGTETQPNAKVWEQPSVLLRASNALVHFAGRTDEQERLKEWRDAPAPLAVRVMHGPGGQGKTRLAGHLAHEWAAEGWVVIGAYHHRDRQGPDLFAAPNLEGAAGVLVVVDYAERWDTADLLALLSDTTTGAGARLSVRVLLLSRPAGTWWQTLSHRIKRDLDLTATRVELGPLENDSAVTRAGLFSTARDRFADLLEVPSAREIAPPETLTDHADFRLVLAVHMAALAAVLGHGRSEGPPSDPVEVSAYLLGRERAHWQDLHTRGEAPLATTPDAMGQVVYTATLTGALGRADATEALEHAAVESREHPGQLLKDHAVCYPPAPVDGTAQHTSTVLEPLYPDRLGEDYLALLTAGHAHDFPCDEWADDAPARLLASRDAPPPAWARHVLTTLIEAAARWPHVAERQLYPLLRARPALALEAGGVALAALATLEDVDPALLETIDSLLPKRHIDLDIAAAALATRLVEHRLDAATTPAERARIHDRAATRLYYAGQRDHALTQNHEALLIWRELTDEPEGAAHLPYLAALPKQLRESA